MPAWLIALLVPVIQQAAPYILTGAGLVASYLFHRYVKNAKAVAAFDWLRAHVGPVVAAVEQTYVDSIVQNGSASLTPEQKAQALKLALKAILDQIPADYLDILRKQYPEPGQLEEVITTLIEAAVKNLEYARKGSTPIAVFPAIPMRAPNAKPSVEAPKTLTAVDPPAYPTPPVLAQDPLVNPKANPPE